ncbi:P-loop containing nucleoside triphosphate hydrolase protein [Camillea tinctor]|nr:P-loop containing nucleoside triphosphate hydrolase protein [Camillea tinctor]
MMKSIPGLEFYKDKDYCRVVDFLLATISKLKVENSALKQQINNASISSLLAQSTESSREKDHEDEPHDSPKAPTYDICHEVKCRHTNAPNHGSVINYFRDTPRLFKGDSVMDHLRGCVAVSNMLKYFEEHPDTAFVVNNEYTCEDIRSRTVQIVGFRSGRLMADSSPAESNITNVALRVSLVRALVAVMNTHTGRFKGYCSRRLPLQFSEPYFFFYVHNRTFMELADKSDLDDYDRDAIKLLCSYFEKTWRQDWDEADELFAKGKLLIGVKDSREDAVTACQVMDWPWAGPMPGALQGPQHVRTMSWEFNGNFQKQESLIPISDISAKELSDNIETDITTLPPYPLRFAKEPDLIEEQLISRGTKFWNCRKQKLICYMDSKKHDDSQAERRFMVDYTVFQRMHPKKDIFDTTEDHLGQKAMNRNEPPEGTFLACLPARIHAYDLSDKKWKLIPVDQTTDVTWNKNIFKRLVLPAQTKELVQAVVTAHGQQITGGADIVGGKGQGVLILLHGGPGTGKTLTAEGIAEEQERALFRVTCGDIGIEPAKVERYLKVVLGIGKAWGCVVLLDEADVFLEERSPVDHKRNAIISIFLRVLEYYDGILILTTNRVGRFDEAFKSRMQLALGYPNLDEGQRGRIWLNFFQLLDSKKERFDIRDLNLNAHKLAKFDINGRQIRNAVMMARHLAKFRNQRLVYKHVQEAVSSVVKFDEYLQNLKGASDDEFAEYDRVRAKIT